MSSIFKYVLLVVFLSFSAWACGKKTAPSQVSAPGAATPAPVSAAPTAVPAPAAPTLEGEWTGMSSGNKDLPVSFSVREGKVSSVYASYSGKNGSCNYFGSFSADAASPLNGKTFSSHGKKDQVEFDLTGTFTSGTDASGTVTWKGKSDLCGDISQQYQWTAKKGAAEAPDADDKD
ncbi:MAG: hypothetical protein U1F57_05430 [bacterium]